MSYSTIKSYAKINLALNIICKSPAFHKIESIISFIDLNDSILIKRTNKKFHKIKFKGKFSKNIYKNNTISKLFKILEDKNLLGQKKFEVIVTKNIPSKAGLGGGSMNAACILKFFIKKKIIKVSKNQIVNITKSIGSDVILGLYLGNLILNSKNKIKKFINYKKIHILIVKPNFGCSTKKIYSGVKSFNKPKFSKPRKKMFNLEYLKKMHNSLELVAFQKYPKLKKIKLYLEKLSNLEFTRMTGSGSALIAYFSSKKACEEARKKTSKQFKNYWCMASKTI